MTASQDGAGILDAPHLPSAVAAPSGGRQLLGQYLLERKLISADALNSALMEQKVTKERLGAILVRTGFLLHKDLISALEVLDPSRIATERVVGSRIPPEYLDEYEIILTAETDDKIYVSTGTDERTVREIVLNYYPEKEIIFTSYAPDNFDEFVTRARTSGAIEAGGSEDEVLDKLLFRAISAGASDIHIEPKHDSYSVFFRELGVRKHRYEGGNSEFLTVKSQIKDRARMDLSEQRVPQDGGFQIEYGGKLIDLRVAAVPSKDGEKMVIRVLDPDRVQPKLESLGITRIEEWRRGFNQMHGICLCCGPTGSGKTTTLNATIREMDRFGKSVYTVEDPVEYRIDYSTQVGVNESVGLDFAKAVRAFMRADPDVIVVGEIRDEVTARIALRAADTGHLVVSTLHTGDIIGTISRMRDLDVSERQLLYLLRSVMVQTLVRAVCLSCRGRSKTDKAVDCRVCSNTGYSHRTVVSECVTLSEAKEWMSVLDGERFWPSKLDDAMSKLEKGIVDEEELRRAFGSAIDLWRERNPGKGRLIES